MKNLIFCKILLVAAILIPDALFSMDQCAGVPCTKVDTEIYNSEIKNSKWRPITKVICSNSRPLKAQFKVPKKYFFNMKVLVPLYKQYAKHRVTRLYKIDTQQVAQAQHSTNYQNQYSMVTSISLDTSKEDQFFIKFAHTINPLKEMVHNLKLHWWSNDTDSDVVTSDISHKKSTPFVIRQKRDILKQNNFLPSYDFFNRNKKDCRTVTMKRRFQYNKQSADKGVSLDLSSTMEMRRGYLKKGLDKGRDKVSAFITYYGDQLFIKSKAGKVFIFERDYENENKYFESAKSQFSFTESIKQVRSALDQLKQMRTRKNFGVTYGEIDKSIKKIEGYLAEGRKFFWGDMRQQFVKVLFFVQLASKSEIDEDIEVQLTNKNASRLVEWVDTINSRFYRIPEVIEGAHIFTFVAQDIRNTATNVLGYVDDETQCQQEPMCKLFSDVKTYRLNWRLLQLMVMETLIL
ncbi:MAG: hypothetical protein ISR65_07390 [Bacteriovoracaceae bacterium]|nr:hypothetical protein [Bacteriovoracaceae bacterium]